MFPWKGTVVAMRRTDNIGAAIAFFGCSIMFGIEAAAQFKGRSVAGAMFLTVMAIAPFVFGIMHFIDIFRKG